MDPREKKEITIKEGDVSETMMKLCKEDVHLQQMLLILFMTIGMQLEEALFKEKQEEV